MRLEIGNFYVKDVVFGKATKYEKGLLTINKQEVMDFVMEDEHITSCDIVIAKPGDSVRIVPVKEAVEPRCRIGTDKPLFPGVTGDVSPVGDGVTHALKGCSILAVGMHWGSFGDGLIDMSGEGAKYSLFSQLINICLVADTDEEFERHEQQKKNRALRWGAHKLAEYIGKTVENLQPEDSEVYENMGIIKRGEVENLPSVVYVMQSQSQMEEMGYNDLCYGWDMNHALPTFMNPNEVLDGAMISGSFMPCSSKWSTYDFQNCPTIKELYANHGRTINFLGVIMSNLNVSLEQKQRSAQVVAQMAKNLGAEGAILAEEGYGNPDADFILCFSALEDAGVKTVGMTNECTGRDGMSQPLVTLDERANAIVSCGNVSELIVLPPMENVIGELESLSRDGLSGGWAGDEILGPSVRADGSIIMENNAMFCGDMVLGWSTKQMKEM